MYDDGVLAGLDFTVWDGALGLQSRPEHISITRRRLGAEAESVRLSRGSELLEGPGVVIVSFRPSALRDSTDWHIRDGLLAFAESIGHSTDRSLSETALGLEQLAAAGGAAADLTINDQRVAAARFAVSANGWVVASREPEYAVAVAGSFCHVPDLTAVDWRLWQ
jgi:hypothetical protein